ncbi:small nucleolar ribonucleoprotein complex subunit [Blastomyces dermatitidis ER-3]|uniref:Small nucleolar ribonucleoprotein complex subunit n=1 Tax=Ajellomyces dermatitidis (strain ER-3 / ATCC MYA-2586) TaxID=559297 RepID=A0ABP2EX03_AJEDR|nr:small nucleolar ribonucleoprotein complex subunit [Blastomyces dermatitidis ER-3]EEQ88621.2 small nucleolar ribonucleoprotein complex subunit [Blastomyces dermatitidis ER-3]
MSKINIKTTFEVANTIRPIYTGGSVSLDASGRFLVACVGEDVLITDLSTGAQLATIEGDGEVITSVSITPSASHLAICSRSLSMRIYSLVQLAEPSLSIQVELLRTLKPHTSPVVTSAIDVTGTLLATGSSDGSIKIWDIRRGFATHTFHGHGGVISALCFFEAAGSNAADELSSNRKSKGSKSTYDSNNSRHGDFGPSTAGFRLASGSEDGKIRVWDLHKRKTIASLESHVSVVRSLSFSPSENALLSASRDKTLIMWDARTWKTRRIIPALESVEAAGFLSDESLCYIGGENGRLRIWDPSRGSEVTKDQDPGQDQEGIIACEYSPNLPWVMTIHADQTLRLHSIEPLLSLKPSTKIDPLPIIRRISGNDDEVIDLACVGRDRSLVALATNTEYIRIVSTNKQYSTGSQPGEEQDYFGAEVRHLEGHEDIIICLDVDWSGCWLATGAKDNTARLWRIDTESSSFTCFATLTGHAESLGAIAFPRAPPPPNSLAFQDPLSHPPPFLFTGSQDRTLKRWDTSKLSASKSLNTNAPKALYTRKAHDKDINALDVNYSSTLFASASQDRTAKIWSVEDGSVLGILRGHKRGVWSIRFAPKDTPVITSDSGTSTSRGVVATGSADKTIKLWSLSDYSCLLTFEGHTNSVLKLLWLPPPLIDSDNEDISSRGAVQVHPLVASAGADGLVKIWSPYSGEIETTLDNHVDRVWALATPSTASTDKPTADSHGFALISGGADSVVTFWKDTTSATLSAAVNANTERIEQDQQLQNYIHAGAYREAITLALQLNHPARLLSLFTAAMDGSRIADSETEKESLTGNPDIDTVLQSLDKDNLYSLLLRVRDWNTNARTAPVAQRILYALSKSYPPSTFIELANYRHTAPQGGRNKYRPQSMKEILDTLVAYTERHYKRIEELVDESYLVEWVLGEMNGGIGGGRFLNGGGEMGQGQDVIMAGV